MRDGIFYLLCCSFVFLVWEPLSYWAPTISSIANYRTLAHVTIVAYTMLKLIHELHICMYPSDKGPAYSGPIR